MITCVDNNYSDFIKLGRSVFESFIDSDEKDITPEQINELCSFNRYYIDYDILTESATESNLNKLGIDAKGKAAIQKCSKDIAKTIKEDGINSDSRKKIHNYIADTFKSLADGIKLQSESLIGETKNMNKQKAVKACLLVAWNILLNTIGINVLTILFGPVGASIGAIAIAPIVEESSKVISIKGGFEKEYYIIFNAFEFTSYISRGLPAVAFGQMTGSQLVRGRLAAVGMHTVNTAIHKLFDSDKIKQKLNIKSDEDSKDKANTTSFIIGVLLHGTWNALASFSPAFTKLITG